MIITIEETIDKLIDQKQKIVISGKSPAYSGLFTKREKVIEIHTCNPEARSGSSLSSTYNLPLITYNSFLTFYKFSASDLPGWYFRECHSRI